MALFRSYGVSRFDVYILNFKCPKGQISIYMCLSDHDVYEYYENTKWRKMSLKCSFSTTYRYHFNTICVFVTWRPFCDEKEVCDAFWNFQNFVIVTVIVRAQLCFLRPKWHSVLFNAMAAEVSYRERFFMTTLCSFCIIKLDALSMIILLIWSLIYR